MRIVETYDVIFRGQLSRAEEPQTRRFTIQDDDGSRFEVHIPKIQHLTETFHYMSENDCIRHLKTVEPVFTTNLLEIEEIVNRNTMIEEHAYLDNSITVSVNPMTMKTTYNIKGILPVPQPVYECKWTFRSKEHAVMVKLAQGGNL